MSTEIKCIFKPLGQNGCLAALIFLLIQCQGAVSQVDSTRLQALIIEAQEMSLYISAPAIYLSPYENREFHRDRTIKNIELVETIDLQILRNTKEQNIPYQIIDNQTIVQQPDDPSNKYTYSYLKDGRISKILRGRSFSDGYEYDKKDYLIQHGKGGELKRAKRKGKTFDWYNVKRDRLEYTATYNDHDRISEFKTMGHFFGPNVDYEIELYSWKDGRLIELNKTMQYKDGKPRVSNVRFEYDSQGLLTNIGSREGNEGRWYSHPTTTAITYLDKEQMKITISQKDNIIFSMTFDQYDNWVEMIKGNGTFRREIQYRKKRRRK